MENSDTDFYLEECEDKISELEKQVQSLKVRLKKANDRLVQYDRIDNNRFRYESDYLPYEDDRYE
jgi:uncharacterized protein involved in exopolysaccharide biosynthesis